MKQSVSRRLAAVLCAGACLFVTEGAMAQGGDSSAEIAALKEAKERAELESAIAAARLKAAQDTAAAEKLALPDPVAQAAASTAVSQAEKAAADAELAAINADVARDKARFGSVTGSTFTGDVTVGAHAGDAEATLLAAGSLKDAAQAIADAVVVAVKDETPPTHAVAGHEIILLAGSSGPGFGNYRAFQTRVGLVEAGLERAQAQFARVESQRGKLKDPPTKGAMPGTESVAAITAVGSVIDLAAKLGSYFQSDYKVAGATVSGVDDDLLLASVAGALRGKKLRVWIPSQVLPMGAANGVTDMLKTAAAMTDTSASHLRQSEAYAVELREKAEKFPAARAADKKAYLTVAAMYDASAAQTKDALKAYQDLVTSLAGEDKEGVVLINKIYAEKALYEKITAGAKLLLVSVKASVGGNYTKKNLWTFFGGMPFYVSGGAVVKYTVYSGVSGEVERAGLVRLHTGYHKLNEVVLSLSPTP